MPMPHYPVLCYAPGCDRPACYKVAARWSDGVTQELKTYSLSCRACLLELFARAGERRDSCRLAPGESLDLPGVYELSRGGRDATRKRCRELESDLQASPKSPGGG